MRALLKEFREFALKGNMIDIAIGVIIGASFNRVIDVLVKQVFMPPLSLLTDGGNWSAQSLVLRPADPITGHQEVAIGYGLLLETSLDFLIISFTVFVVVRLMNQLKNKAQDPKDLSVQTPKDIELLSRITELLEKQIEALDGKKG